MAWRRGSGCARRVRITAAYHGTRMTRAKPTPFPRWRYYPPNDRPPQWVHKVVEVVQAVRPDIDTAGGVEGVDSDEALAHLRPGLEELGYQVESGKHAKEKYSAVPSSSAPRESGGSSTRSMRLMTSSASSSRSRPAEEPSATPSTATSSGHRSSSRRTTRHWAS